MLKKITLLIMTVILSPIPLFPQGENWVYRYGAPGNLYANAKSIVYGVDGNIYAAGFSTGTYTSTDFLVISLDPAGDSNWVYWYNGPWNYMDQANALAAGVDSNVYAVGFSTGHGSDRDFTVISLTPAGGTNWLYKYNGPGNGWDEAFAVVFGPDNNIYTAGYSNRDGIDADFTIISLNNQGSTNWIYQYTESGNYGDYARSIAYGQDGNIYTAGSVGTSYTSSDFTVISLNQTGDTNWVNRYHGTANLYDCANSVVYGADGNIYAAGVSYDSVYSPDFTVISLTAAGSTNWVFKYRLGASDNEAYSLIYGTDGNIYAAGTSMGNNTNQDFIVISLSPGGDTNWVYRYNGPGNGTDLAYSIIRGLDGNIYAAGSSVDSDTIEGFTVISLTATGDSNWIYRYNGPGNGVGLASSIVSGADGNLYAAGLSFGNGPAALTVISLDPDFGVEEGKTHARDKYFSGTIINGPLRLPKNKKCQVLDIAGRKVMPGNIGPGIYFIEIDGKITQKLIKVR